MCFAGDSLKKAQLANTLSGIVTVLNTPFTGSNEIDEPGLRANVRRALAAGVSGFLVPAMAGEVSRLSATERTELVKIVLDESAGTVGVVGGASASTQLERIELAGELVALGCSAVLVALPYQDDVSYSRQLRQLAHEIDAPLMIQDWDPHGYGAPTELLAKLFEELPSFASVKIEVVPAGPKYTEILNATKGRIHVAGGWAVGQMIEGLDRGVHSFMPTGMHEIYCEIVRRYRSGYRAQAVTLFRRLLPILAFSNQHLDISIRFFKRLLWREGIYATANVREPLLEFDEIHLATADTLIEEAIAITGELQERR